MRKIYALLAVLGLFTAATAQISLPIDFESNSVTYTFTNFDGGNASRIDNPQITGINTSAKVGRMVKGAGQSWGGSYMTLSGPIDFSTNKLFKMKVFAPKVGTKVLLKVENETSGGIFFQQEVSTTTANAWEDLSFDFSAIITSNQYHKLVLIFDLGTVGDGGPNFTYLFDDIRLTSSGGPVLTAPTLPLDFESNSVNWAFTNFDGGNTTRIDNPQSNGINTSTKVARMVKNAGQPWGGSWTQLGGPINFSTNKTFKMKVFSPRTGAKVLLKVENQADGGIFFEREVLTTVANTWEDMTFDFGAINTANQYHKVVIIFDNGTMGDGGANFTFLFDDLRLVASSGGGLTQMNLPVTFDDATVEYGLIGFGGAENSTIVADPTNAANKVAKVVKSGTAELWAGTTVTAPAQLGFSSKIPFTAQNTRMTVRVWSPAANIPVRLKVEDHTDPTKSVETEAVCTVANSWQTLEFNFANQAGGTAALNLAYNYTKASIFFNFGTTGATTGERTYYFDDMQFGSSTLPVSFLDFNAVKNGTGVVLNWSTASEANNKGFAVERSKDGQRWTSLTFVNSKGNSNNVQQYSTTDAAPERGMNYYRLKQVDLDGEFTYSTVRVINLNNKGTISIYPNPARGKVNIALGDAGSKANYSIFNLNGKQVLSGVLNVVNGIGSIEVSSLPIGTYMIRIGNETMSVSEKLILF